MTSLRNHIANRENHIGHTSLANKLQELYTPAGPEARSYTLMVKLLLEKIRYKYTFPQNATMVTSPKPSNIGKVANRPHYLLNGQK